MINKTRSLGSFGANTTGGGVDISDLGEKDFFTWASAGSFSASVQIQVSAATGNTAPGAADPSWQNLGSALAAAGNAHTLVRANWARAVIASWVSGTIQVTVVGDYAHEAGGRKAGG